MPRITEERLSEILELYIKKGSHSIEDYMEILEELYDVIIELNDDVFMLQEQLDRQIKIVQEADKELDILHQKFEIEISHNMLTVDYLLKKLGVNNMLTFICPVCGHTQFLDDGLEDVEPICPKCKTTMVPVRTRGGCRNC